METVTKTFTLPEVEEVPLTNAPLVSVLAQVMFGSLLSIKNEEGVSRFQEVIREKYPVLKTEKNKTSTIDVVANSIVSTSEQTIWRFSDTDDVWRVSLSSEFVALETKKYSSREEFTKRLSEVLAAVTKQFNPGIMTRIGVRYVDRLEGDALNKISSLVNPTLIGLLNSELNGVVDVSISEALFKFDAKNIFARWGLLPPGTTIDPNIVKPVKDRSWILDIDASTSGTKTWSQDFLLREIGGLTDLSYKFFRWSVKNEFLRHFGGKV
jgi:uncharacterized protein (TIGR04255 family)